MASDASEKGGGFVMARRLSERGLQTLKRSKEMDEESRSGIVVIDMFSGIGGLLRALERQGLKWEHHASQ